MWFSFGSEDIGQELREIKLLIRRNTEADMATNDELQAIGAKLDEAAAELSGLPAQIEELLAQVGDQADPALVASLRSKAEALASIVPNPEPEPTPEPTPEP